MSVPKSERSISRTEFFHSAYRLNDEITQVLLKDLGMKTINRDLKVFTHQAKMNKEDAISFSQICTKYHIDVEATYPLWLLDYYRQWILRCLRDLISNITKANTIYINVKSPNALNEFNYRRQLQWNAISSCEELHQAFKTAIFNLPVDVNSYTKYLDDIENEIVWLKEWKKSDNRFLKYINERAE